MIQNNLRWGREDFCPNNQNPAVMLGEMDFHFKQKSMFLCDSFDFHPSSSPSSRLTFSGIPDFQMLAPDELSDPT